MCGWEEKRQTQVMSPTLTPVGACWPLDRTGWNVLGEVSSTGAPDLGKAGSLVSARWKAELRGRFA